MNAETIREQLTAQAARINGQRNLTPQAKRTLLARAYLDAANSLEQLRQDETAGIEAERRKLERKLFGNDGFKLDPNAAVSRRDAADRAARINDAAEAAHLMQRAERDGDTTLAKAIASRAADMAGDPIWGEVVNRYVADKPSEAETLKAMQELPDTADPIYRMQQAMRYGITTPEGLGDVSHYQAEALASQPLDGETAAA